MKGNLYFSYAYIKKDKTGNNKLFKYHSNNIKYDIMMHELKP